MRCAGTHVSIHTHQEFHFLISSISPLSTCGMWGICLNKAANVSESWAGSGLGGMLKGTTSGLQSMPFPTWRKKKKIEKQDLPDISPGGRKLNMLGPVLPGPAKESQHLCFHVLFSTLKKQDLRKYLSKLQMIRNANTNKGVGEGETGWRGADLEPRKEPSCYFETAP